MKSSHDRRPHQIDPQCQYIGCPCVSAVLYDPPDLKAQGGPSCMPSVVRLRRLLALQKQVDNDWMPAINLQKSWSLGIMWLWVIHCAILASTCCNQWYRGAVQSLSSATGRPGILAVSAKQGKVGKITACQRCHHCKRSWSACAIKWRMVGFEGCIMGRTRQNKLRHARSKPGQLGFACWLLYKGSWPSVGMCMPAVLQGQSRTGIAEHG